MSNKEKKENKKLIKRLKKLKDGESLLVKNYEVLRLDNNFYIMINPKTGEILDKHFIEIVGWLNGECELD